MGQARQVGQLVRVIACVPLTAACARSPTSLSIPHFHVQLDIQWTFSDEIWTRRYEKSHDHAPSHLVEQTVRDLGGQPVDRHLRQSFARRAPTVYANDGPGSSGVGNTPMTVQPCAAILARVSSRTAARICETDARCDLIPHEEAPSRARLGLPLRLAPTPRSYDPPPTPFPAKHQTRTATTTSDRHPTPVPGGVAV